LEIIKEQTQRLMAMLNEENAALDRIVDNLGTLLGCLHKRQRTLESIQFQLDRLFFDRRWYDRTE
jgi:hypothetical protein